MIIEIYNYVITRGDYIMIKDEKKEIIQSVFDECKSIQKTCQILQLNYRTVCKYIDNKPSKRKCNPKEAVRIYSIVGSLARVAKILNISKVTAWRNLKSEGIVIGTGAKSWRRLYSTLRRRVTKSQWRKDILQKYDYKCAICKAETNIVHHSKKLSDLRDEVVQFHPDINPFNSYAELRQFTDLVMMSHKIEEGIVLCRVCHENEHSK